MLSKLRFLLLIVFSSLMLSSCSDDPSSIGSSLIDPNVELKEMSSDSVQQSSSFFKNPVNTNYAPRLLLGKVDETEAFMLVKFNFTGLTVDQLRLLRQDSLNIQKSYVQMFRIYTLGDKNSTLNYSVHRITQGWTLKGFTADSLSRIQPDMSKDISSNHSATNDSLYSFDVDPSVVKQWLRAQADSQYSVNQGMYFKPSQNNSKIVGFQAATNATSIMKIYTVVQKKSGGDIDTLSFSTTTNLYAATTSLPAQTSNLMYVQGAGLSNATLKFDFTSLPKNAIISSAILELNVESAGTEFGSPSASSMRAYYIKDASNPASYDTSYTGQLTLSGAKFTGEIRQVVQKWFNGEANNGIGLALIDQENYLDRVVLKGSGAAAADRPRLRIIYSTSK